MGDPFLRAAVRWLAHPVSLMAVAVMAINDHVLKSAWGGWWTGKLSDVAGLVFFPALVAVVLAAARAARADRSAVDRDGPPLVLGASAVVAVGFAWVKATALGAATASAVLSAVTGPVLGEPSVVRADATDLLALPALGLAAWAGLGVMRGRAPRRASDRPVPATRMRRALAVAAVPLAILASTATGVSEDSHARVVTDVAVDWRGQVKDAYPYGGDAYYTWTAAGWELYFEDDGHVLAPGELEPELPASEQMLACVPSDPDVCFRAMEGTTGVETSTDGGATWRIDWQLSPEDVAALERAYGETAEDFETHGVGVAEVPGGFEVVAGNGTDGFAVRRTNGEWERVGFAGMDCCDWLTTADLATVDELPAVHALPLGLVMGVGLATLALPCLAFALRRGRRPRLHISVTISAWLIYLTGAFFGVGVMLLNADYAPLTRAEPGLDAFMFLFPGAIAVAVVYSAAAAWGLLRRGAVLATLAGAFAGTLVAGIAASAAESAGLRGLWPPAGVAVGALAAFYAVYVPLARRWWVRFPGEGEGAA